MSDTESTEEVSDTEQFQSAKPRKRPSGHLPQKRTNCEPTTGILASTSTSTSTPCSFTAHLSTAKPPQHHNPATKRAKVDTKNGKNPDANPNANSNSSPNAHPNGTVDGTANANATATAANANANAKTKARANPASQPQPVYRVLLTGGPCGGKSSALATLHDELTRRGLHTIIVPESATTVLRNSGGFDPAWAGTQTQVRSV